MHGKFWSIIHISIIIEEIYLSKIYLLNDFGFLLQKES